MSTVRLCKKFASFGASLSAFGIVRVLILNGLRILVLLLAKAVIMALFWFWMKLRSSPSALNLLALF